MGVKVHTTLKIKNLMVISLKNIVSSAIYAIS